ncbi:alpha/beta hydrolase family protein [Aspergillus lucknowensis]|uniref:Hydrolases or acyltransferase n=1 Tax=Aspergillus lucknowensis TaxID=176173 RepID=A0ABR4LD94_9EURO
MKLATYIYPLLQVATSASCRSIARADNNPNPYPTFQLSNDSTFNFNFVIALGNALTGGSDIGPVLGVAKDVIPGDFNSYVHEWIKLANQTKAQAEAPENAFDPVNVRDTWFSASHYFRRADEYVHQNWSNPLLTTLWDQQTAAFDKAIAALPIPGRRLTLPSKEGDFLVEAIWYEAPPPAALESKHRERPRQQKRPTLVLGNGFDAAQEDLYHYFVAPALARGWNCITYEGPGQPTERVVTPVVDYLLATPEISDVVDADRLVLLGNSFGGYLAARAAAFEPRFAAVILIGGVWDVYLGFAGILPPDLKTLYEAGEYAEFDREILSRRAAGELPGQAAWGLDYGRWAMRTKSPSEFFTKIKEYHIGDVVDKIKVPVFVGDAEYESIFPGQPQQVKGALGDLATLHIFNGTAGYHCQSGAIQEMTRTLHAWLHKTLSTANDRW